MRAAHRISIAYRIGAHQNIAWRIAAYRAGKTRENGGSGAVASARHIARSMALFYAAAQIFGWRGFISVNIASFACAHHACHRGGGDARGVSAVAAVSDDAKWPALPYGMMAHDAWRYARTRMAHHRISRMAFEMTGAGVSTGIAQHTWYHARAEKRHHASLYHGLCNTHHASLAAHIFTRCGASHRTETHLRLSLRWRTRAAL